ncbi:amidohydrolase/deacetylase family metallohydrolase [Paenibacillus sp. HB172176]|uniref:amidohydrolase/deacetylase family metallohydrolase n=1 Tax=Paenibacillus sp. HB172176 TaxID=2493690 RepID=UPI00143C4C18|nr:amidohydrolase/deacetylase family metallohydrolase [Paenibacillus sp. HB172176]
MEQWVLRDVALLDGRRQDIVITDGIVSGILPPGEGQADRIVDGKGQYVSPGWIDLHVHAVPELDPYGDEIDEIGVKLGVGTIVDAGSCGADRIGELQAAASQASTRVRAFLNISHIGLARIDELSQLEWLDEDKLREALEQYQGFIVGMKARISRSVVKEQGLEPLRIARKWSDQYQLPLMVHIGSGPPAISEVMDLLRQGDIVTHFLNGKANNLFDESGEPIPALLEALARGVHLDVGHGTASFSFEVAERAKAAGIHPGTISTDIYKNNRLNGPVFSMADTMSKFLLLGYRLQEVVQMVTRNAAERIGQPELGRIEVGGPANLTLFEVKRGAKRLVDSEGQERIASEYIEAKGVVVDGTYDAC